jgi:four helix bundle protein
MNQSRGAIVKQSFEFAVSIIQTYKYLIQTKKEFVISKQLLRSGTAVGALVREAQNAESNRDFIHKLSIAQKECAESQYWLEILKDTGYIKDPKFDHLHKNSDGILKMIRSAIITSKKKTDSRS